MPRPIYDLERIAVQPLWTFSEIEKYLAAAGILTPDPPSCAVVITQNALSLLPEAEAPKISRKWAYEGGKVVKLTHLVLRVQTRPKPLDFYGRKIPQHAFLRRGSKRICPMSQLCGM